MRADSSPIYDLEIVAKKDNVKYPFSIKREHFQHHICINGYHSRGNDVACIARFDENDGNMVSL